MIVKTNIYSEWLEIHDFYKTTFILVFFLIGKSVFKTKLGFQFAPGSTTKSWNWDLAEIFFSHLLWLIHSASWFCNAGSCWHPTPCWDGWRHCCGGARAWSAGITLLREGNRCDGGRWSIVHWWSVRCSILTSRRFYVQIQCPELLIYSSYCFSGVLSCDGDIGHSCGST